MKNLQNPFEVLDTRLSNIERILQAMQHQKEDAQSPHQANRKFDIHQAADYLNLTVPTLYSKNSKGELPSCKVGKRLYFFESDLVAYLQSGRNKTNKEIEKEASEYLNIKSRRD